MATHTECFTDVSQYQEKLNMYRCLCLYRYGRMNRTCTKLTDGSDCIKFITLDDLPSQTGSLVLREI